MEISHKKFPCKICDFQSTMKGNLSRHVKNVHEKGENVNCTDCNKSVQKASLMRHMKLLHLGEQTKYKCKLCTFETVYPSSLYKHVNNVHQSMKENKIVK